MRSVNCLLMIVLAALTTLIAYRVDAGTMVKREIRSHSGEVVGSGGMPQKRPFCNAFTGCGRKRSETNTASNSIAPLVANFISGESEDEYLARLSRRIMAEARLWELLQQRLTEAIISSGQGYYSNEIQANTPVLDLLGSSRKRRSTENPKFVSN